MKNKQASQKLVQWKVVVQHIREDAAALPYLTEEVASLEQLMGEAERLVLLREAKKAEVRQLSTSYRQVAQEGNQMRGKIQAILNGKLGFTDDRLVRYGFDPRRVPRRKPKPQPEAPAVAPTLATKAESGDSPP